MSKIFLNSTHSLIVITSGTAHTVHIEKRRKLLEQLGEYNKPVPSGGGRGRGSWPR